jgi:hypothetical protein
VEQYVTTKSDIRLDHLAIARAYAADPDAWPLAPRFGGVDPRGAVDVSQRWYHRLAAEHNHEVWLLTWLPGQGTDLHDHGGSAGAFVVVSGELTERTVTASAGPPAGTDRPRPVDARLRPVDARLRPVDARLRPVDARLRLVDARLGDGIGRWFGPHHIHQITNNGLRPAVSVHVYGPALKTMTRYVLDNGRLRLASIDRAGVAW